MLEIQTSKITVLEAVYILSNNDGYFDSDYDGGKGALIITGDKRWK